MSDEIDAAPPKTKERANNGTFLKGKSGNPSGKRSGTLAKTTKLKSLLTDEHVKRARNVLLNVLKKAEGGSVDHEKMVINALVLPFARADANSGKKGDGITRPPNIVIQISKLETPSVSGPPANRIIDVKPNE